MPMTAGKSSVSPSAARRRDLRSRRTGERLFVSNFMDRSVSVFDLATLLDEGIADVPLIATWISSTADKEKLSRPGLARQAALLRRAGHAPGTRRLHQLRLLPQRRRPGRTRVGSHRLRRGPAQHGEPARPRGRPGLPALERQFRRGAGLRGPDPQSRERLRPHVERPVQRRHAQHAARRPESRPERGSRCAGRLRRLAECLFAEPASERRRHADRGRRRRQAGVPGEELRQLPQRLGLHGEREQQSGGHRHDQRRQRRPPRRAADGHRRPDAARCLGDGALPAPRFGRDARRRDPRAPGHHDVGRRSSRTSSPTCRRSAARKAPPAPRRRTRARASLASYFNNTTLAGSPALERVETVNFSWSASPGAGVNADNFSVRWTGFVEASRPATSSSRRARMPACACGSTAIS